MIAGDVKLSNTNDIKSLLFVVTKKEYRMILTKRIVTACLQTFYK